MKKLSIIVALTAILAFILPGSETASAQNRNKTKQVATRVVSGIVFDDQGEPLVGAAVQCKALKNGVSTDLDGRYSIDVPAKGSAELYFSFIGMEDKSVSVSEKTSQINVTLKSDEQLEAAVINAGYGFMQRKENLTGSAFEVKGESLQIKPANRLDDLLVGQVPGMNVIEDNSTGRTTIKVRIRGDGSLSASSEPLWVIDGNPVYTGTRTNSVTGTNYTVSPLSFLNVDDIESMTVLKDASTTALYGMDGSNGVILVTTKSAQMGKTSYNASIQYGLSNIDRSTTLKYTTTEQWWELAKTGWANRGYNPDFFPYQDNEYSTYSTTDTDWFKVYMGTGQTRQVNFSASNGTKNADTFFSLSYFDSTSPVKGNYQNRYSVRSKSTFRLTDKLSADFNLSGTYNHNDIFSISNSYLEVLPIFRPYDDEGNYVFTNYYSTSTDKYEVVPKKFVYCTVSQREENDNYQDTLTGEASASFKWKPFKGMTITNQNNINFINISESSYTSFNSRDGLNSDGSKGSSRRSSVNNTTYHSEFRANYAQTFAGKLAVNLMAGAEFKGSTHRYVTATGYGFANDFIKEIAYANTDSQKGTSNISENRSLSYMTFGSLSYDRRYSLTGTFRRQGHSAFSEYSRWDNLWSVGANWNVHHEDFFKSNSIINSLIFKAAYGANGNSRVDTSSAQGTYVIGTGSYYAGQPGASIGSPANPGLTWEKTYTTNIGGTIGLFNHAVLMVDYYLRETKNILYGGRVSYVITDGSVTRNIGEMENRGIEFTLDVDPLKIGDFSWDLSINGSRNTNKITKLYKDSHTGFFDSIWTVGASKNAWWLVRWAGVDPVSGAPMWYDYNGDLTYTFSYNDRVLLPEYSHEPDLMGGVTNSFHYKGWKLTVMCDYSIGGWDYNTNINNDGESIIEEKATVDQLYHWEKPGDTHINPRYVYDQNNFSYLNSTRNLVSKTYVQLRSVALSYTLPSAMARSINMKTVTASLVGDNLYLWTPGQYQEVNSYKNIKYSTGMRRGLSLKLNLSF